MMLRVLVSIRFLRVIVDSMVFFIGYRRIASARNVGKLYSKIDQEFNVIILLIYQSSFSIRFKYRSLIGRGIRINLFELLIY